MKYPSVATILTAHTRAVDADYSKALAERLKPRDPSFIPTNNPALNAIVAAMRVPVLVDVPNTERDKYGNPHFEVFPYTNNQTGTIHMPHPDAFLNRDYYAHVVAHELGHFTMNAMKRPIRHGFTFADQMFTDKYGDEELVAEMTAMSFEMRTLGRLAAEESSLSYLRSFLQDSNEDHNPNDRWEWATREADKATEYLLSFIK